jgi:hypothetical protein
MKTKLCPKTGQSLPSGCPKIDPHDLSVKLEHAIGFLSEDMKVKVTLKFRGREMPHTVRARDRVSRPSGLMPLALLPPEGL